jgi:hypothetical protein
MSRLHDHLLTLCKSLPGDYDPWGNVIQWGDPNQAYPDCAGGCKWYLTLEGHVGADWGVCANAKSHRAGLLTFEHQGCQQFELLKPSSDDLDEEMACEPEDQAERIEELESRLKALEQRVPVIVGPGLRLGRPTPAGSAEGFVRQCPHCHMWSVGSAIHYCVKRAVEGPPQDG